MKTFFNLLENIRKEAFSQRDKGTRFEELVRNYFLTSKKYKEEIDKAWLWENFPYRKELGGTDTGIDVVIYTRSNEYWAVQCKCYAANANIGKPEVDSFLATSSRTFTDKDGEKQGFSYRFWVDTAGSWSSNATQSITNQQPPVSVLNAYDLDKDITVDWEKLDEGLHGIKAEKQVERTILSHQAKAIENAHEYYKNHDRGKMIMACGTGKTYTALKLSEQETKNKGLILVMVPSIALINQTLNEWDAFAKDPIRAICVCSDNTASRRKGASEDDSQDNVINLAMPACTDPKSVAKQISEACQDASHMVVVYSTYQSIDVVSKAQKYLNGELKGKEITLFDDLGIPKRDYSFDFIICDEAHRTTGATIGGKDESAFVKIHDNTCIKGKKRLYMTATPRLYEASAKKKAEENSVILCSMDDTALYGDEFYRIGFGEAVEKGLLSDYKVLVLTVRDNVKLPASIMSQVQAKDKEINADDAIKLVGCINALSKRIDPKDDTVRLVDPALMHRAVAFCSRIVDSKAISHNFNEYSQDILEEFTPEEQENMVNIEAQHIDGSMNAKQRETLVSWLKSADTNSNDCRILTNVRCLSEGVDVPSLDAVIFLSARNSQVDVVQSVGRVMRVAPGKKYGYIIIPVVVPADGDPNTILDNNKNFAVVWTVLNALRAHDDRFNALVNKLELNEKPPTGGGTVTAGPGINPGESIIGGPDTTIPKPTYEEIGLFDSNVQKALYAKMVLKVGTKKYWEQWATDIADIANRHKKRIENLVANDDNYITAFSMFMEGLHKNINPNISKEEAIEMLAQHMITKPVFEALFENYSFVKSNPISKAMNNLLELVGETAYEKDQVVLKNFYKSVQERCAGLDNAYGKQKVIIELYDKFFKKALPQTVEKLGIVYTPVEVVDFINQSVADVLKKEFNRTLSDENVHIIDPFTGTGTFITRMLQSGLIEKEALTRKYTKELHANEIVLLAYYIASINIENAYHDLMKEKKDEYTPFNGICLTDTFQLYEDKDNDVERLKYADVFPQNSERVIEQNKIPMQVIIANPPYSVGQTKADDNAQNNHYPKLENRIANTYAAETNATNKAALYDSYIKAFRWASDRLEQTGGIIGFVTNAGWLGGSAMDGLRKCFEKEFSSIYMFNLRGNARTSGEQRRKEKDNVFGQGSRAPIAITILVKNPKAKNKKAEIYYHDIGDYLNKEEKLRTIINMQSVLNKKFGQKILKPNIHGDWINQRSNAFSEFTTCQPEVKFDDSSHSVFSAIAIGMATNRDAWIYSYSREGLLNRTKEMIEYYNRQVQNYNSESIDENVKTDKKKISWSRGLKKSLKNKVKAKFKYKNIRNGMYRPFNMQNYYDDSLFIESPGVFRNIFPKEKMKNLTICMMGKNDRNFSTFITRHIPDYQLMFNNQCFPLYWYSKKEDNEQQNIFETKNKKEFVRHDGVTDFILNEAQNVYHSRKITKEDIFYYVYGLLHSEDYRTEFAADLKKMLPRIPLVESYQDFKDFSEAGRKLADLHLNYETCKPPKGVIVEGDYGNNYDVTKIRYASKEDMSKIIYNDQITISNIPKEAYEYVVNGRTAVGWILERYQIKKDKDSGIVNDPNDWGKEHGNPRYILDLLLSIITVSVETMKIVKALPKIKFDK